MERLNEDARFEVFDAIAELVDDGVFVLMGVCTEWQAQVLRSPRLWRYITISDNVEDMQAKLGSQLVMSTGITLVVRVHFPLISLQALESALQRKIADLIVILGPLDGIHDQTFSILQKTLLQCQEPQIARVLWRDSTGDHPYIPAATRKRLTEVVSADEPESLEPFLRAHPAPLLSAFGTSHSRAGSFGMFQGPEIPLRMFHLCAQRLRQLMSLTLDGQSILKGSHGAQEAISLPRLQILHVDLDNSLSKDSFCSIGLLLITPGLRKLTLHGGWVTIYDYLSSLQSSLQLEILTLLVDPSEYHNKDSHHELHNHGHRMCNLAIEFHSDGSDIASLSPVQLLTTSLSITHIRIHIPTQKMGILQHLTSDIRIYSVHLEDIGSETPTADKPPTSTGTLPTCQFTCDTLVLKNFRGKMPFERVPRPRRLIISSSPFAIPDLLASWASSLHEMEADDKSEPFTGASDNLLLTVLPLVPQAPIIFTSLRYLKCEVRLALAAMTSGHEFPVMEELYIQKGQNRHEEEVNHLLSLLLPPIRVSESPRVCGMFPELRTLGLDWFPEWEHICTFLKVWVKTHGNMATFTLKLPRRPTRRVLSVIVQLLNGATPDRALPGTFGCKYATELECRGCTLAGWRAKGDCEVRHGRVPISELFRVTRDTEY